MVCRRGTWASAALSLLILAPAGADSAKKEAARTPKERPDAIARPSWGRVVGWVLDAESRKPLPDARIAVEVDGAFPEEGKTTALTDAAGRFEARAPLGKISSKFDWGRLLTMHPISLLLSPRSATKQTKVLDVSQVNVRVEREGYRPFVGRVRATLADAGRFQVTLDDVWLAPASSNLASFTPENLRLEVVENLEVQPAIASPGEKVKIVLTTLLPIDRGYKYRAYATSSAIRVVENQVELKRQKPEKGAPQSNRMVFTGEVKLPTKSVDRWAEISFFLVRDEQMMLRQRDTKALLQIVRTPEERAAAERVAEAWARMRLGDKEAALQQLAQARKAHADYHLAHLLFGDLSLQLNRPADAAQAYGRLVALDPRDYEIARSRYALALIESGKPSEAMEQLGEAEKVVGKDRVPAHVSLARARVFAAQGNFVEADKWLARAGQQLQIPEETLAEINLKRMSMAVAASPQNPDLRLSYARVLAAARRRDEAVTHIRKAAELDPSQPWPFLDLAEAYLELGRPKDALAQLEHAALLAPENPEVLLALADAYRDAGRYADALPLYRRVTQSQKMNLRARHHHALMLYATGDLAEARRELVEVIAQARDKGDLREEGIPIPGAGIYFGPKRRLVAGFSVPEAAADMAILEALQDLEKHPNNALLWQNIGNALLDLELPGMALPALQKSLALDSGLLESRFLLGVAYRKLGQSARAVAELRAVVEANQLHPRARLELAQIHTDRGELEQAQAQLLAHTNNYPYQRTSRPATSFGG